MTIQIALRQAGSLKGVQPEPFEPGQQKQLLIRRLLPEGGWYLALYTGEPVASSDAVESKAMVSETTTPIVVL